MLLHFGHSQSLSLKISPPRRLFPPLRSPPFRSPPRRSRSWNDLRSSLRGGWPWAPFRGSPHRLHSCRKAKLLLLHFGQIQSPPLDRWFRSERPPRSLRSKRPPRSFLSNRPPRSLRSKRPPRSFLSNRPLRSFRPRSWRSFRPRSPKLRSSRTFLARILTSIPTRAGMSSFLSRCATCASGALVFPSTASTLPM